MALLWTLCIGCSSCEQSMRVLKHLSDMYVLGQILCGVVCLRVLRSKIVMWQVR